MTSTPSTSTASCTTEEIEILPQIKVPKSASEEKQLKQGHQEDDNSDIAYMNFPLYAPNLLFTCSSYALFIAAVSISLYTDWIPPPAQLRNGFNVKYGASLIICRSDVPIGKNWLPSIIHLFEVNVIGNVLFRLAVGLPMAVRVVNSWTLRNLFALEQEESPPSVIAKLFNELMTPLMLVEVLSLTLFSIITVHSDFPEIPAWNRYFKLVFASVSVLNMFFTMVLLFSFTKRSQELLDIISVGIKSISFAAYTFSAHQFFHNFQSTIPFPFCHSYVPFHYAIMEYIMIAAYAAFHTSILLDIRDAYLVCYPRTCSGECEPLDPANFQKGGKFEHCRSFEYNQRRLLNL